MSLSPWLALIPFILLGLIGLVIDYRADQGGLTAISTRGAQPVKNNSKKIRAKRLARWMNRLAQVKHIPLTGYAFFKGIAIPLTQP